MDLLGKCAPTPRMGVDARVAEQEGVGAGHHRINFSDGEDAPRLHEWALSTRIAKHGRSGSWKKCRAAVIYCPSILQRQIWKGWHRHDSVGQSGETVQYARAAYPVELAARHPQRRGTALRKRCCFLPVVEPPNWRQSAPLTSTRGISGIDAYAAECDLHPPSPKAKETAQEILEKIARAVPRDYAVSPWDDGVIVVHIRAKRPPSQHLLR